jgi:hypothetical protein
MDRSAWGLPAETNENGKEKRIWLPQGLIIPHMVGGKIYRLRIRRPNPKHSSRYIVVSGSKMNPMSWDLDRKVFVAVESELDGLLLNQTVGDLVGILAVGSAQAKPDVIAYEALSRSDLILVALDYDDAGANAFKRYWAKTHPQAKRWPVPDGKDPGDAFFAGVDLRAWIRVGLENREAGARL